MSEAETENVESPGWTVARLIGGMMKQKENLVVQYEQWEEPKGVRSPLSEFAAEAWSVASANPLAIPDSLCGRASRVQGGMLAPSCLPDDDDDPTRLRIKSICSGTTAFVQRTYDSQGRLVTVRYADGVDVRYTCDSAGRLERVTSGVDTCVIRKHDAFGNVSEFQQNPGSIVLTLRNALHGGVERLTTPSGEVSWVWERGRVSKVSLSDGIEMVLQDGASGDSPRIDVRWTGGESKLPFQTGSYAVMHPPCSMAGMTWKVSPLGVFRLDAKKRVFFWLQPNGEPLWFFHNDAGHIVKIWSARGVTVLQYKGDVWSSVLTSDGARYLRWPAVDTAAKEPFFVIGPDAVSLVKRDSKGRLVSVMGQWGDSTVYGYGMLGQSALPASVTSPQKGRVEVEYTEGGHVKAVEIPGKGSALIQRAADGAFDRVDLRGKTSAGVLETILAAGFLFCLNSSGDAAYRSSFLWSQYVR